MAPLSTLSMRSCSSEDLVTMKYCADSTPRENTAVAAIAAISAPVGGQRLASSTRQASTPQREWNEHQ